MEAIAERPDGTRVPFLPYPTPLRDASGALVGAVNMLVDISEQKAGQLALQASEERLRRLSETLEQRVAERTRELAEANERLRAEVEERTRAEAALSQAQKMEAIGQLASGIAHDFNNLLAAIIGNLELLETRLSDERLRKLATAAARSAHRGAKLNEQMLAFSRKQRLAPRSIDLNALLGGTAEMLRRTLGGTVAVETRLAGDLWPALVDPTQVELMVLNLAINARDAMPAGGAVRIETRNARVAPGERAADLVPGDYVAIAVTDSGTGMSDDVLARACEPFFTTKDPGKGSGLGLSQVYGVARQSGGALRIRSRPGDGTAVEVYLPRAGAEPETTKGGAADAASRQEPRRQATVLVVDDQADVREVAMVQLETLGYRAIEAASAANAIDILSEARDVDLVLADYAMPGMSGAELADAVRRLRPSLPVVIATGYVDTSAMDGRLAEAVLLKKPYRMSELASAIETTLADRAE
jgi:signal transduction histidine kinase/ActR/RegA family two-component response regulator